MAARRARERVCIAYDLRPAPSGLPPTTHPPHPPAWIPAVAGIRIYHLYVYSLFSLLIISSPLQISRVAILFEGLGRFIPCLNLSFLSFGCSILFPFFSPSLFYCCCYIILSFISFTSVLLAPYVCTWLDRIARRVEGVGESRKRESDCFYRFTLRPSLTNCSQWNAASLSAETRRN